MNTEKKIPLEGPKLKSQGWGQICFHLQDLERLRDMLPSAGLQESKTQGSCTIPAPLVCVFLLFHHPKHCLKDTRFS